MCIFLNPNQLFRINNKTYWERLRSSLFRSLSHVCLIHAYYMQTNKRTKWNWMWPQINWCKIFFDESKLNWFKLILAFFSLPMILSVNGVNMCVERDDLLDLINGQYVWAFSLQIRMHDAYGTLAIFSGSSLFPWHIMALFWPNTSYFAWAYKDLRLFDDDRLMLT